MYLFTIDVGLFQFSPQIKTCFFVRIDVFLNICSHMAWIQFSFCLIPNKKYLHTYINKLLTAYDSYLSNLCEIYKIYANKLNAVIVK